MGRSRPPRSLLIAASSVTWRGLDHRFGYIGNVRVADRFRTGMSNLSGSWERALAWIRSKRHGTGATAWQRLAYTPRLVLHYLRLSAKTSLRSTAAGA